MIDDDSLAVVMKMMISMVKIVAVDEKIVYLVQSGRKEEEIGGFDYLSTGGQAGVICAKDSKRDWGNNVKFTGIKVLLLFIISA